MRYAAELAMRVTRGGADTGTATAVGKSVSKKPSSNSAFSTGISWSRKARPTHNSCAWSRSVLNAGDKARKACRRWDMPGDIGGGLGTRCRGRSAVTEVGVALEPPALFVEVGVELGPPVPFRLQLIHPRQPASPLPALHGKSFSLSLRLPRARAAFASTAAPAGAAARGDGFLAKLRVARLERADEDGAMLHGARSQDTVLTQAARRCAFHCSSSASPAPSGGARSRARSLPRHQRCSSVVAERVLVRVSIPRTRACARITALRCRT